MVQVLLGILLHAIGASCAALCYVPQKKTTGWSWQTYWLAQAAVCWLLLPIIGAIITIPHLADVLREAPKSAMINSFLLGMAYGIGGTAFGMAIRYVGFSLTYAIAVGISCVLGTLLPPMLAGTLNETLQRPGAGFIIFGIATGAAGIAFCGIAGRFKELHLSKQVSTGPKVFNLSIGLPLCLLAGVLSAVYGISLAEGKPISDVAAKYGAGDFQGNVIYLFSNTGAFLTTLIYCLYLHFKNKTFNEYKNVPLQTKRRKTGGVVGVASQHSRELPEEVIVEIVEENISKGRGTGFYFLMSALTGVLWYAQFFFYGLGHQHMGSYKFTSWAIHMIMLVLFSTVAGLAMKEWASCNRKTVNILALALTLLLLAVLVLTYGNYLGGDA
ncbi:MAG: L-rhamnose/proton symporter RhaT [Bacteroidota bacterium]